MQQYINLPATTPGSLWSALGPLVGFAGGFATAIFGEPLRQRLFRPNIVLSFGTSADFITPSPAYTASSQRTDSIYVRIRADNTTRRLAKGCRAYLTSVEREVTPGTFERTEYCDSLQLAWSAKGADAYKPIELARGAPHFIDLLFTLKSSQDYTVCIDFTPIRYLKLLSGPATLRFTVMVTGEGTAPTSIQVIFKWTGVWDKFTVAAAA